MPLSERLRALRKEILKPFRSRKDYPTYGWNFVYALCEPDESVVRYIGCTNDIVARYSSHVGSGKRTNHLLSEWIDALKDQGKLPRLLVLARIDSMVKHLPSYSANIGIGTMELCAVIWPHLIATLAEESLIRRVSAGTQWNNSCGGWTANLLNIRDNATFNANVA